MTSIQTTTMKVPKTILEEIKIYCRKSGKPIGEFIESAWDFIKRNDFDIYDHDSTPCLMVPEVQEQERNKVDLLCDVIGKMINAQQQLLLPPNEDIKKALFDKASAETKANMLEKENKRLREQIEDLQKYKEKAHLELCRVQAEQKTLGKIKVNIDL